MMDFLVFRLYGTMSGFGKSGALNSRPVWSYPSKSAMLGVLGAALGVKREDSDRRGLEQSLGYGVLVENRGNSFFDYQTTRTPGVCNRPMFSRRDELQNGGDIDLIETQREYRINSLTRVAFWVRVDNPVYSLESLKSALDAPKFFLYLGRKDCPLSLPLESQIVRSSSLYSALTEASFMQHDFLDELCKGKKDMYWDETSINIGVPHIKIIPRKRDVPLDSTGRHFTTRREFYAQV